MTPKIKLYGLSSCSHCKGLRNFLLDNDVKFDWAYVDMLIGEERNKTLRELKKLNPLCSFPTVVIGETVIVGYKKDKIRQALADYQATP
ncbi:NrdH-redoxin [Desulfonema ishimotonii]|uniref:NrdH-redoxin n=1 Tax=Desulfonema ishimotonii TaxID=45657 RepID=A0A401FRB6_9BACT|nr:glutaredoxin family protein [Desulfonema ishimotonii]GBC59504.1 NrdH-redoxin [Desulfonema ishimotonii]